MTATAAERARKIRLILMDVDGTLTDGTLIVTSEGEELKTYHVRDGLGILLAKLSGLDLGIITGKTSKGWRSGPSGSASPNSTRERLISPASSAKSWRGADCWPEEVAYIGDDVGDLAVMKTVGLAGAVADAHPEVREHCQFISGFAGGHGAVREFIEFILKAQGKWDAAAGRVHDLRAPAGNPKREEVVEINSKIFREYDIRGIVDQDLDAGVVETLGKAMGTYFLAAREARSRPGPGLPSQLSRIRGRLDRGLLPPAATSPTWAWSPRRSCIFPIFYKKKEAGVMITGSHNPPEHNGFKIMRGKKPFPGPTSRTSTRS